jgi:hypothetical protein
MRWPWRKVRVGTEFEKADREHNRKLAEELLTQEGDDFALAVSLIGWKLTPAEPGRTEKWPLVGRTVFDVPAWCASIAEQEREIQQNVSSVTGGCTKEMLARKKHAGAQSTRTDCRCPQHPGPPLDVLERQ